MNWYLKVLKQYANISGRARRTEYWMFNFFNFIFLIIAISLDYVIGTDIKGHFPLGLFYFLYGIPVIIPGLAVTIRRLHDIGKNAWMILVLFIPIIGVFWFSILMFTDSIAGLNQYGAYPKEVTLEKRLSNKTVIFYKTIVIFFVFILTIAIFTNPNENHHKYVLKDRINKTLVKSLSDHLADKDSAITPDGIKESEQMSKIEEEVVEEEIEKLMLSVAAEIELDEKFYKNITIENYLLFSVAKFKNQIVSYGFLGNIFLSDNLTYKIIENL